MLHRTQALPRSLILHTAHSRWCIAYWLEEIQNVALTYPQQVAPAWRSNRRKSPWLYRQCDCRGTGFSVLWNLLLPATAVYLSRWYVHECRNRGKPKSIIDSSRLISSFGIDTKSFISVWFTSWINSLNVNHADFFMFFKLNCSSVTMSLKPRKKR